MHIPHCVAFNINSTIFVKHLVSVYSRLWGSAPSIMDEVCVLVALCSGKGTNLLEKLIFLGLGLTVLLPLLPVHCRSYTWNANMLPLRICCEGTRFEKHAWEEGLVQLLPNSPANISNPILGTPRTVIQVVHCTMS